MRLLPIALLLAILPPSAAAAEPAPRTVAVFTSSAPLSLSDCVRLVLRASPSLRVGEGRLEQSRRLTLKADAAFLPTVDFNASQVVAGYDNAGTLLKKPRYDDQTHSYTLNGSWNLFNNFRDERQIRLARLDHRASQIALNETRQGLVMQAVRAFFKELQAKRFLVVRRQFLESQRDHLGITEKLYASGVRSYVDLLNAKVQSREKELSVLRAELSERSARGALNLLLDRPLPDPLELQDVSRILEAPGDLDADTRAAMEIRPESVRVRLEMEKTALELKNAWADLFPALSLDASLSYRFDQPTYTIAPGVSVSAGNNPFWQAQARLSFPVFDGLSRWQEVKRSRLAADLAKENLEEVRREIASGLLEVHMGIEENRRAYEMSHEELKTAEEYLAILLDQYRQGTASSIEVKDAQNSLLSLQESEAQALYDYFIARTELLKAVGTLSPEAF